MRQPIIAIREQRGRGQHPGLILTRFMCPPPQVQNGEAMEKRALFEAAIQASRNPAVIALYRRAFDRWDAPQSLRETAEVVTPAYARLIVGLGSKGVIEAGLRLHHTYGVPLVPGSALKGIAAHYCAEVRAKSDAKYATDGDYHRLLFGTTDDGGVIGFEDGWMHPDSLAAARQGLLKDVMTPHHQDWQTKPEVAPTDFDSPVPVPFLSVAGRFRIAVCWRGPDDDKAGVWTKRALVLLLEALAEWGVGGKTSSGYGRLVVAKAVPASGGSSGSPTPSAAKPGDHSSGAATDSVTVKVLAKHEAGGRSGFWVQEVGKPKGLLLYGTPPKSLPEIDAIIQVFRNNNDLRNPQYRWDRPSDRPPPGRPPRGPQRPSR